MGVLIRWQCMDKKMSTTHLHVGGRSHTEPLSTEAQQWFYGWAERHIVAADPYDNADVYPRSREKRRPLDRILVVGLFGLSALTSITGVTWLVGQLIG
jgi:hypothetical protein